MMAVLSYYNMAYHAQCAEDGSASGGAGAMERSEDSGGSLLGGEADSVDSSGWSDTVGLSDMDQISAELASRGPPKSDLCLLYTSDAADE